MRPIVSPGIVKHEKLAGARGNLKKELPVDDERILALHPPTVLSFHSSPLVLCILQRELYRFCPAIAAQDCGYLNLDVCTPVVRESKFNRRTAPR